MNRASHADSPRWNAERRKQIALQNQLANAVRTVHNIYCPCPEHERLRRENAAHPLPDAR